MYLGRGSEWAGERTSERSKRSSGGDRPCWHSCIRREDIYISARIQRQHPTCALTRDACDRHADCTPAPPPLASFPTTARGPLLFFLWSSLEPPELRRGSAGDANHRRRRRRRSPVAPLSPLQQKEEKTWRTGGCIAVRGRGQAVAFGGGERGPRRPYRRDHDVSPTCSGCARLVAGPRHEVGGRCGRHVTRRGGGGTPFEML